VKSISSTFFFGIPEIDYIDAIVTKFVMNLIVSE